MECTYFGPPCQEVYRQFFLSLEEEGRIRENFIVKSYPLAGSSEASISFKKSSKSGEVLGRFGGWPAFGALPWRSSSMRCLRTD